MSLSARLTVVLAGLLLVAVGTVWATTIDVSPAQNITNTGDGSGNGYYERDPQMFISSGGTWYLIYARSQTLFTPGGNPDGLLYDIYYQTSTDSGASWSSPTRVLDAAAIAPAANFRSAAVCEADGKLWVIGANVESLEGDIYANTYSGGSWSGQTMIFDGTYNTGAFHVDAVAEGDDIRLFYGVQNETKGVGFIKYHGATDAWDSTVTYIDPTAGWQIPRVIKAGSTYYLVSTNWEHILFTSTTTPDVVPWPAATYITTAPTDGASSDPCILKYGESGGVDKLIVFHAPWYPDDSQPQEYVYSTDAGATWSASIPFTDGLHGTLNSWDMMPRAYMKDSETILSFFGMEKRDVARGQGDIVSVPWKLSATVGNAHYTTIQDGVDNAGTGGGIAVDVLAGLYDERVLIDKSVTIRGATAGVSKKGFTTPAPPAYAYDTDSESVISPSTDVDLAVVRIMADDVTLDGLIVANAVIAIAGSNKNLIELGYTSAVQMPIGVQILNCVVGPDTGPTQDGNLGRFGIVAPGPSTYAGPFTRKFIIRDNTVYDCLGNGGAIALIGGYDTGEELNAGSVIENNTITGNHRSGIEFAGAITGTAGDPVLIANNDITDNGKQWAADAPKLKYGNGIAFIRGNSDQMNGPPYASTNYIRIYRNTIEDNEKNGIYFGPANKNITIEQNFIRNNGVAGTPYQTWNGVQADLAELYYTGAPLELDYLQSVALFNNDCTGNGDKDAAVTGGIPTEGPLDASGDWWGTAIGSEVAGRTAGSVDYTPWLAVGTEDLVLGVDPGFQGDFRTLWVDDDCPQGGGGGGRIQEAVDMVSGSTVHVLDGSYTDHVVIDEPLTLLGPNAGVNPNTETRGLEAVITTDDLTSHQAVLIQSAGVTVDGFTLYGPNGGTKDIGATGLSGAGARTNVHIQYNRIFRSSGGTDWNGDGLRLDPPSGFDASVYIEHNRIEVGPAASEGNNCLTWADHAYRTVNGGTWTVADPDRAIIRDNYLYGHSKMYIEGIGVLIEGNRFLGTWGPIEVRGAKDIVIHQNLMEDQTDIGIFAWSPQSASGAGVCTDLLIDGNVITGMKLDAQSFTDMGTAVVVAGVTNATITGNTLTGGAGGGVVVGGIGYDHFYPADIDWGGGLNCGYDPVNNVIQHNIISGNTGAGLDNRTSVTVDATCGWWGDALGPNVPPENPSPGDNVVGSATYAPWWTTLTGPCDGYGPNSIAANTSGLCLSSIHTCVTVPVVFTREDATAARAASVTFRLSDNLGLCGSVSGSIHQGSWLAGYTNKVFQAYSNGDGTYTVDQAILGLPCGVTTGGTLFSADVKKVGEPDGVGTITVTAVHVRNCSNGSLPGIPGAPAEIGLDFTAPIAIADLDADQVKALNDADGTTKISVTFSPPTGGGYLTTDIYRMGYGNYPEYDDPPGGAVPSIPATPTAAIAAGWVLAGSSSTSPFVDEPPTRDFYYYVAFSRDECDNVASVSNMTGGTLNYHLGDVSNGSPPLGTGDNVVDGLDISHLGFHYGITLVPGDTYNYLDVGPTTDRSPNARPTTDNKVGFEDLLMFAMNYGVVHKAGIEAVVLGETGSGAVRLEAAPRVASAHAGDVVEIPVLLRGAVRDVQAIHTVLAYDTRQFAYVSSSVGSAIALVDHFFKDLPSTGAVDLSIAMLGSGASMNGEGVIATVRLRALRDGRISVALKAGNVRDTANAELLAQAGDDGDSTAETTPASETAAYRLNGAQPNPFNGRTSISFEVPAAVQVRVTVYDVAGRSVRTLAGGRYPAGQHVVEWDGADDAGRPMRSGVYFYAMQAGAWQSQKRMTLLR